MTDQNNKRLVIRSKIWIENENGEMVFGLGRLKILKAVHRLGSLQAAAKELKMSYRAVWGKLKATEERLGIPLLIRKKGGASHGGSQLVPEAEALLEQFNTLHKEIIIQSDHLFKDKIIAPKKQKD